MFAHMLFHDETHIFIFSMLTFWSNCFFYHSYFSFFLYDVFLPDDGGINLCFKELIYLILPLNIPNTLPDTVQVNYTNMFLCWEHNSLLYLLAQSDQK